MLGPPRPPPAARLEPTCHLEALSYEYALRAQAKHCCLQELGKFANRVPRKETNPKNTRTRFKARCATNARLTLYCLICPKYSHTEIRVLLHNTNALIVLGGLFVSLALTS